MSSQTSIRPPSVSNRSINAVVHERYPTETSDDAHDNSNSTSDEMPSFPVLQRQKQWTTEAAGVPHFLCVLAKKNNLLFACDKLGSIDLYQLDSTDAKNAPRHLRHFELFPGNSTGKQAQIIETFTVYTPFIVVAARRCTARVARLIDGMIRLLQT